MKKYLTKTTTTSILILLSLLSFGQVEFTKHTIVRGGVAETWWARSHADINNDGLLDFFVINNNAHGGELWWFETVPGFGESKKHIIAKSSPV